MEKKCIIIPAYIEGSIRNIVSDEELASSLVICADAGFERAAAEGIVPDILVGDLDSVDEKNLIVPPEVKMITANWHKDETDFELAVDTAVSEGCSSVLIAGGFGGRIDHTLGNIQNMVDFYRHGVDISMKDERNYLTVLESGSLTLSAGRDVNLSILAHSDEAEVSVTGVEWPLKHYHMTSDRPLGVSNFVTGEKAEITVYSGTVLVMICK